MIGTLSAVALSPKQSPKRSDAHDGADNMSYPWFALQVRSRHENVVSAHLSVRGYEWLLPMYKCRRRWSDRIKEFDLPLFPGYIFCNFNPQDRLPILTTPGVSSVVGIAKMPVAIDDSEIEALQSLVRSGVNTQPCPFLQVGQRIRIEHGALVGIEGILLGFKGRHRIVLSVTLLQRSVAAEIDSAWVIPVRPLPPAHLAPVHPIRVERRIS
jgi:transcriptional antiterminator NusG